MAVNSYKRNKVKFSNIRRKKFPFLKSCTMVIPHHSLLRLPRPTVLLKFTFAMTFIVDFKKFICMQGMHAEEVLNINRSSISRSLCSLFVLGKQNNRQTLTEKNNINTWWYDGKPGSCNTALTRFISRSRSLLWLCPSPSRPSCRVARLGIS